MCGVTGAAALMVASVGLSAYQNYQGVKAQNKANEYSAQVAEKNAALAELSAQNTERQGEIDLDNQDLDVANLKGRQRSAMGSSGVLVDTGSFEDALVDTARQGEEDSMTIRHNASMKAWNQRAQSGDFRDTAAMDRLKRRSAGLAAGTSLLSGGSSAAGFYAANK